MSPAGQRIFALVPTTLVTEAVRDPRPMTSKAAKKAHLKANRGPKVSREEQRRLDAALIERNNKEFEREKAAAKAKVAREKKVEKENAAKLERKKKGIPEPSKFVRAGQATISSFFNMGGRKRKREEAGGKEEVEGTTVAEEKENGPPPAKRVAMIQEDKDKGRGKFMEVTVAEEKENGSPPAKRIAMFQEEKENRPPPAKVIAMIQEEKENEPSPAQRTAMLQEDDDEWDMYQGSEIGYLSESDWI